MSNSLKVCTISSTTKSGCSRCCSIPIQLEPQLRFEECSILTPTRPRHYPPTALVSVLAQSSSHTSTSKSTTQNPMRARQMLGLQVKTLQNMRPIRSSVSLVADSVPVPPAPRDAVGGCKPGGKLVGGAAAAVICCMNAMPGFTMAVHCAGAAGAGMWPPKAAGRGCIPAIVGCADAACIGEGCDV
jgi:hypothetical protein